MKNQSFFMRQLRASLALLALTCPLLAVAEDVIVEDANGNKLTYSYEEATGPATLKGINAYATDASKSGRIIIADRVTDANGNSHVVKYIGGSLSNRSKIVTVKFGANIVAVGGPDGQSNSAFNDCDLLESVTLNANLEILGRFAFYGCNVLESINLQAATKLKKMDYRCLGYCPKLTSVTIPASVEEFGSELFYYSSNLASITFNAVNVPDNFYRNGRNLTTITFGAGVKSIGTDAFYDNDGLTTINIPSSVSGLVIGKEAFRDCDQLRTVTLPKGVVTLGESVFYGCDSLRTVTIATGSQLDSIARYAFAENYKLQTINLEAATKLKHLMYRVFYDCRDLQAITIPASVIEFGNEYYGASLLDYCNNLKTITFNAANVPTNFYQGGQQLTTINFGAGVKNIGNGAFYNNDALTTINISSSASGLAIGKEAFRDCDQLRSVTLAKGVVSVGESAFYGCDSLRTVTIATGSQLDSIARYAFAENRKTQSVNLEAATKLKHLMYRAFYHCDELTTFTIPASVIEFGNEYYGSDVLGYDLKIETINFLAATVPDGFYRSYYDGKFTTLNIGPGVKRIGKNAFADNYYLKNLNIDPNVSGLVIGDHAFSECDRLDNVVLPAGVVGLETAAFRSCDSIHNFTFAEGCQVTSIPVECFYYNLCLQKMALPDAVTTIGARAFGHCRQMTEISFGTGLESLPNDYDLFTYCNELKKVTLPGANYPFVSRIWMPDDVTIYVNAGLAEEYRTNDFSKEYHIVAIGEQSNFAVTTTAGGQLTDKITEDEAINLQELTISGPINGTDINYLHSSMPNLRVLNLKNARIVAGGDKYNQWNVAKNGVASVESYYGPWETENDVVGYAMFYNMPALQSLTLPNGTKKIGNYAMAQDRRQNFNLAEVVIPSTVTEIGNYAFWYSGIRQLTVPSSVTELKPYSFWHCEKLQKATLPDGIYTIGNSAFSECYELTDVNIPSQVVTIGEHAFYNNQKRATPVVIPNTCKTIDYRAFMNNYVAPSITIGNNVETIGSEAFRDCRMIEQAVLPESVTSLGDAVFYNCDSLRSFAFPQTIKQVPAWTLQYCDALTSVTLADGTTTIGEAAFADCPNLSSINITGQTSLTTTGNYVFDDTGFKTMTLPNSITEMGYCPFQNCHQLESVNVPTGIDYVPYDFCENCENLKTVQMHDGIRTIRHDAFLNCKSLESIELNEQISSIEYNAFYGCEALQLQKLPDALTFIGDAAFYQTKAFTAKLTIPSGVTRIDNNAFNGSGLTGVIMPEGITTMGTGIFAHCLSLKTARLPQDMKRVTNYMFQECKALDGITLPDNLTEIGHAAFEKSGLTSIILPDTIQVIESYAFSNTKLTTFRVPDGFTSDLGSYALENCKELRSVYFGRNQDYSQWSSFTATYGCDSLKLMRVYAGTPPKSDTYNKSYRFNCVLEVPEDQVELYQQANFWKDFKEIKGFFMGDVLNELDFAVMKLLYDNLDGANWTKKWDLSNDHHAVGKWSGVTTEKMGGATSTTYAITSINLADQGLVGQLPDSIFLLRRLQSVNLSNNALQGDLGTLLANRDIVASTVTEVDLHGNQLKGDLYPFLERVPNVTKVDVSYNRLTAFSEVFPNTKLTNNNLSRGYQFVDYKTRDVVDDPDMPVSDITPGIPAAIAENTLQTYRHERGDYNYTISSLYRVYGNGNGGTSTSDWELKKNSDGLWDLYADNNNYVLKAPKGQPVAYTMGDPYWSKITYIVRFDWQDGDVNADQTVDVTDLQSVVNYALNDRKTNGQMFNYTAADANSDKAINVADVVGSVEYILNYTQPEALSSRIYKKVSDDSRNVLTMDENGVVLNHADEVAALQFTVRGVRQGQLRMGEELSGRFTVAMRQVDGGVRIVVYSPSGNTLAAGSHQLLASLPAGASLTDVCLSGTDAQRLGVSMNEATAVQFVDALPQQAEREIYDLSGRRVNAGWDNLPQGVYVVRVNGKQFKVKK